MIRDQRDARICRDQRHGLICSDENIKTLGGKQTGIVDHSLLFPKRYHAERSVRLMPSVFVLVFFDLDKTHSLILRSIS
jgi:hypothetical protein